MIFLALTLIFSQPTFALDVKSLIERTEQQSFGKSFEGHLKMTIERPSGTRVLEIQSWTEGKDKAMVKVLRPAKDRGTANLRLDFNLWQYLPKIERTIKIPPSLMLQSWMGSDFTNDDLVKASRFSRDYNLKFKGYEKMGGVKVAKIDCLPKQNAPVVWGKVELWVEPKDAVILQQDFFTENGEHIKRLTGTKVKKFGSHTIASVLKMENLKKKTSTTLEYIDAKFDHKISPSIFRQSFLRVPVKEN